MQGFNRPTKIIYTVVNIFSIHRGTGKHGGVAHSGSTN
jgi:hypothetical protein